MNQDFHYYATYVAASLAGYNESDAICISHAAQYVDDSTHDQIVTMKSKGHSAVPTVHSFSEITAETIRSSANFYDEVKRVWSVFHFLPGNFETNGSPHWSYRGKLTDEGSKAIWKYDQEAQEQFKLLCRAQSPIVKSMIADLVIRRDTLTLEEIGLRMHVLADTWAHMYFAGIPSWFLNTIKKNKLASDLLEVEEADDEYQEIREITAILEEQHRSSNNNVVQSDKKDMEVQSLSSAYYNSYVYLGHCQAEHEPDYPYLSRSFRPQWHDTDIVKHNSDDFTNAFKEMLIALYCIRTNTPFSFDQGNFVRLMDDNQNAIGIVTDVLKDKHNDQTSTWKTKIGTIQNSQRVALNCPPDYKASLWKDQATKNGVNFAETSYYKFNVAAIQHLTFVKSELSNCNLYLDNIPEEEILKFQVKGDGKYISSRNKNSPTLSLSSPQELEFILPKLLSTLRQGLMVKIRTREQNTDGKIYLGAWSQTSFVYDRLDENIFRQKWEITQDNKSIDEPIDYSSPTVYIKNVHWCLLKNINQN